MQTKWVQYQQKLENWEFLATEFVCCSLENGTSTELGRDKYDQSQKLQNSHVQSNRASLYLFTKKNL